MEIYSQLINSKKNLNKYFPEDNICFLDIETTGLSRKYNQIYLIGMVYFDIENNSWRLTQIFIDHINEEKQLLENFNELIGNFNLCITYNGDSFDLPFIKYRAKNYGIRSKILDINSFDIYRKIRNNNSYLHLKNLKLKTIEESLGIYRKDEYSGKDCINFYYEYMKTKDPILKQRIIKHNYDDLYYLLDIVKIFDHIKDIKNISIDFNDNKINIYIKDIIVDKDVLKLSCHASTIHEETNIIYYENNFNISWKNKNNLTIDLEIMEGFITPTKKCLFINKNHYPLNPNMVDLSQFMVPNNIILLKVENKYEMENIKNIIKELILYILN
jgi:uncharacterized protein YprB with RNaseH-like and TPR domain